MGKMEIVDELDEAQLEELGNRLVRLFKIRPIPHEKNRFDLEGGDKTPIGVARTVIALLKDAGGPKEGPPIPAE